MSWQDSRLGDILTLQRGHDLPNSQRQAGDVPVVSSSGITGRHNVAKATAPGVVTGRYGTIGEVFYIEQDYWPLNTALYVTNFKENNPRFITYLLRNILRNYQSDKAAVPGVNRNVLHEIKVRHPDRKLQDRIASILSAYDDLIENNRRRIQLLEQAARLLYKEWFVHLRYPGHDHAAQQPTGATELHPEGTSANDSANPRANIKTLPGNSLPEGWERKKIDDVCETVGGGTPSTKTPEYWDGDITWVVPSDITKNDSLALLGSERKITEKGLRESSAKMVPAETILMTSRASVGFFAIMDYEICTNQGFINIIPHDKNLRMYLLFNLMNRVEEIRGNAKGSTYPEISKGRFRDMDIIVPPEALISEFSEIAHNIIRQARILKKSTMKLEKARDLLLPRLMDGQVEV